MIGRWIIRGALAALALAQGCQATGPAPGPTPLPPFREVVTVDVARVRLMAPAGGLVRVRADAGAIRGVASTVTLTVTREPVAPPAPVGFRLLHLGTELPITSGYAVVRPDGGFDEVTLGDPERPVLPGDELNMTPQQGTQQAGYTVFLRL